MSPTVEIGLQDVLRWMAAGGLAGAGARFGHGALGLLAGGSPTHPDPQKAILVRVPAAPAAAPAGPRPPALTAPRPLVEEVKTASGPIADAAQAVWDGVKGVLPTYDSPFASGSGAAHADQVPWRNVGIAFGTPLAAYLGWQAAGPAVAATKPSVKSEMDRAREEYYQALARRVAANRQAGVKTAAAIAPAPGLAALAEAFDDAYDAATKAAEEKGIDWSGVLERLFFPAGNVGTPGGTMSLGAMTAAGGLGAYLGYNRVRDGSLPAAALAQARKAKADGPPPVYLESGGRRVPIG